MARVRVLILRAPGTNCDRETAYAFEQAGATAEVWHLNRWLESPHGSDAFQVLCFPGGFSYGDDVAAGRIVAGQIRHHLVDAVSRFRDAGKLILGICNGFQILIKTGLLLAEDASQGPPATLTWNAIGRFEDRWVHLRVEPNESVFLRGIEQMFLPIAHAEGQFVARDAATLQQLQSQQLLALRYTTSEAIRSSDASAPLAFPDNPNGSQANVAGVCDTTGRVFGLMPHPERFIDPTQHPQWTRRPRDARPDGMQIFQNAVGYFA